MVIEPVLAPQVVATVDVSTGKVIVLLKVTVSELISGEPVQELKVVVNTYFVDGTAGGQMLG